MTDDNDILATPIGFADEVLGVSLYPWQDRVLTWFERAGAKRVKAALATPNGAGKSERVVATLVLWWLAAHKRGKVVVTTRDGKQLDNQVIPAIYKHRAKLDGWKFIDRYISTPTGGTAVFFTTDDENRAEGWHREDNLDGPLLIIIDEAKSVSEGIFQALDRCTYNGLLYTSSPGPMHGSFWESHTRPELGFERMQVGLADCPHIPQERIDDVILKYGERHPFTRSTLFGEFMVDGAESRFNFEKLERLQRIAESTHGNAQRGVIVEHNGTFTFTRDDAGWAWVSEAPREGLSYCAIADPMTGEQSEGSKKRDTHGAGILRQGYLGAGKIVHPTELVAAIFIEDKDEFSGAACRWELSILAHRMFLLAGYYGQCIHVPEANNAGVVYIKELVDLECDVWQRTVLDEGDSQRELKKYGFLTTSKSKRFWVEEMAKQIFEESFICRFKPAVAQLAAFIQKDSGACEARPGAFDDFVAAIAIGLTVNCYTLMRPPAPVRSRYDVDGRGQKTAAQRAVA